MRSLLQNPLLQFFRQCWWLFALGALWVSAFLGGDRALPTLLTIGGGIALFLLGAGTVVTIGCLSRQAAVEQRRNAQGLRFLCPACLRLGPFHSGCGECGENMDSTLLFSDTKLPNRCPSCQRKKPQEATAEAAPLLAICEHCNHTGRAEVLHHRQVVLIGALLAADFQRMAEQIGEKPIQTRGGTYLFQEDGKRLTYVLDLSQQVQPVSFGHALRSLAAIWTGEEEPLLLGQAIDRLTAVTRLEPPELERVSFALETATPDPVTQRLLAARFPQVQTGVSPRELLGTEPTLPIAGTRPEPSIQSQTLQAGTGRPPGSGTVGERP